MRRGTKHTPVRHQFMLYVTWWGYEGDAGLCECQRHLSETRFARVSADHTSVDTAGHGGGADHSRTQTFRRSSSLCSRAAISSSTIRRRDLKPRQVRFG